MVDNGGAMRVSAKADYAARAAVELATAVDGPIKADKARLLDVEREHSIVEVTLHSGRNHIVRRMLDAVGHPVVELVRRSFGPLNLGSLKAGAVRELTKAEVGKLLTLSREATAADGAGGAVGRTSGATPRSVAVVIPPASARLR